MKYKGMPPRLRRLVDRDDSVRAYVAAMQREREDLEKVSYTDALTGLWNRRYFNEQLRKETGRARRYNGKRILSLVLADVDYFKQINDVYGHDLGDIALQVTGSILAGHSRQGAGDTICRYGGEEFGALLPHTDMEAAYRFAERNREAMEGLSLTGFLEHDRDHAKPGSPRYKQYQAALDAIAGKQAPVIRISAGVGSFPHEKVPDSASLIRLTDAALYMAKNTGRNRVVTIENL